MHIEIPGMISLVVPWWALLLLTLLLLSLLRRSRSEKSAKVTDIDPLLQDGKFAQIVPYHQTERISKLAKRAKGTMVVVVDVRGPILDTAVSVSSFARKGATFGSDLGVTLEQIALLPEVKAVVVRYSTPGGTVTGSAMLSQGLDKCRAMGKKVVAYVPNLSASGGMWAMASADHIIANQHAFVGSVGVRGPQILTYDKVTRLGGLLGGVAAQTITATSLSVGKAKTFGDPFTPIDEKEVAHFTDLLRESYEMFVERILAHRSRLTRQVLVEDMGARIYLAKEACAKGLIDAVGDISDVKDYVAKAVGTPWENCGLAYLQLAGPKGVGMLFAESTVAALQTYAGMKGTEVSDVLAAQTVQVMYVPPVALM